MANKQAPKLSEQEEARALLDEHKKQLAAKVKAGKQLSKHELEQLQSQASGGGIGSKLWVRSKTDLALELEISRVWLNKCMKRPGAPKAKADGSYFIPDFRKFISAAKGHDETKAAPESEEEETAPTGSLRESINCQIKRIELDERAYDFKVKQGLYLLRTEAKDAIRQCNEKVQMELMRRLCHIAPIEYAAVQGDAAACRRINEGHINEIMELLHSGKW